ncbi:MAG: extracellular solute-binding protein [Spirochaetales bacterium]|nr:extracellular solute-binding protein [Spirochaetales bacterium]
MKSKLILVLCLALLVNGILWATGTQEAESGKTVETKDPITIQFWTRQTQSERQEQIQALIDVFEVLNPDIKVKMLPVEENNFPSQLAAAGEANRPNLIEIQGFYAMSFYGENLIDGEANAEIVEMLGGESVFEPGALNNVKMGDGSLFGLPFHFTAQGFWYRTDWFEEAGLDPPTTWDAILKAAEYFTDPAEKQYGLLIGTKPEAYTQQCFTHLATANDAHLFDKDGNLSLSTPEFREAVELYKELSQYTPPGPQTWRARDYYLQGKMAMFYYSTYIMDDLSLAEVAQSSLTSENFDDLEGGDFNEDLVDNTGFVSTITNESSTGYGEVMALSVLKSKDNAETEAAKRLAEFFMTDENYIPYLHIQPGGLIATKTSALQSDEFINDPKGVYSRYGKEKIMEIAGGLGNIEDFLKKDGVVFSDSATILSKNILARMLYNITIEDKDIDSEIERAEKEMIRVLSR